MLYPALNVRRPQIRRTRTGAVMPLFAVLLPLILIFCGFAINLAYMQLVSTELKIASDAAAHAGGRSISVNQSLTSDRQAVINAAIATADKMAKANLVGGKVLTVGVDGKAGDEGKQLLIQFGASVRSNNGYGMYQFTKISQDQILNGTKRPSSLAIASNLTMPLIFQTMNSYGSNISSFGLQRRSVATQVDRDVALVLDKSGSMLYFKNETLLTSTLNSLYNTYDSVQQPGWWKYGCYYKSGSKWIWKGYYKESDFDKSWQVDWNDKQWQNGPVTQQRRISSTEKSNATNNIYSRIYSDNVIYQLERWVKPSHTLGTSFTSSKSSQLTTEMAIYAYDYQYKYKTNTSAPRFSSWYYLDKGVTAFLNILDITDQQERVTLITFNSSAVMELPLQTTYDSIRSKVASIIPNGGTAIGEGMNKGVPEIINGSNARPFAAKTIVVLTDGVNNSGTTDPKTAARDIVNANNVTIHTVTFTPDADKTSMQDVASTGYGRHYHTDDGDQLVPIFEEIANNLPTILTE